jgi:hypothetical protein
MNVLRTPEDRFAGLPDFGYQVGRQCVGLQAGGEGGRTSAGLGGAVLLLNPVAAQAGNPCHIRHRDAPFS